MRAIFVVLFIINIAFFSYQFFVGDSDVSSPEVRGAAAEVESNLRLLSEIDHVVLKKEQELPPEGVSVDDSQSTALQEGDESSANLCTMVGPYEQLLHAEYLVERLAALGVKSQITPVEIKEGDAYWVYLVPEMSEKEALRRLYELQKKQIESYIITKGELANGISFGRYADRAEAEIRLAEIKTHGYEAQIKTIPKTINETWVVLEALSAEKIDETLWGELLNNQEGLEKRQNYCLGVASQ